MIPFVKPGANAPYHVMGAEAAALALRDAGIDYGKVQQAYVGYVYGDSTCGQRALYPVGMTGIPIVNVNNNCSTGSSALYLARQSVKGGLADVALALGFEKMEKGSLGAKFTDRTNPMDKQFELMVSLRGFKASPPTAQFFGNAGREHMEKYGTTPEQFAKIALKNHQHSVNNPYSQFQDDYTLDQILAAPMVYEPLTKLQCCPTSDGAAAAILASEDFVATHDLWSHAIEIAGMAMTTDFDSTLSEKSCIKLIGQDMTRKAAEKVYQQAGLGPENVDVIELHDCFSTNELVTYEGLGLCEAGEGGELIDSGAVTYGGKWVVNPSGGLISKGHPLGATGLAQCAELNWQLRGQADKRQVKDAAVALQHNLGLGGAAVVTMYRKPERS
jgi:acetyl-CoA acetyltransferase